MGVVSIVFYVLLTLTSENILADTIAAVGLLIAFYYGLTGFACVWFYRKTMCQEAARHPHAGRHPAASAVLLLVAFFLYACKTYADPEYGYTSIGGIGGVFLIGVGSLLLGLVLMFVWQAVAPAYFRGETLPKRDSADLVLLGVGPDVGEGVVGLRLPDSRESHRHRARPVQPAARARPRSTRAPASAMRRTPTRSRHRPSLGSMGHDHGHAAGRAEDRGRLRVVLAVTACVLVLEVVGWLVTGSLALLADAGHMATDAAAVVLALGASYVATLKGGPRSTFGLHRAEVLAALVNAVVLLVVCGYLLYAGISRLVDARARRRRPDGRVRGGRPGRQRHLHGGAGPRRARLAQHARRGQRGARRPARVAARRGRRHRHLDHGVHPGRLHRHAADRRTDPAEVVRRWRATRRWCCSRSRRRGSTSTTCAAT